jgi:putative transposase
MHEIVQTRICYGYQRIHIMLRREGWAVSNNLVYRLYHEESLLQSKRPRRRKMVVHRKARYAPMRPNEVWSLEFIHDQLSKGDKLEALTVVDVFAHEGIAFELDQRLRSEYVMDISMDKKGSNAVGN